MATTATDLKQKNVVSHDEWIAARKQFLAKEKEFTRLRDELSRQRRELPWEKVEKRYEFQGPQGKLALADLFDGRSQLVDPDGRRAARAAPISPITSTEWRFTWQIAM
jgi:predicted dithiol-disulfide oxidoreductase (DUF899 family)